MREPAHGNPPRKPAQAPAASAFQDIVSIAVNELHTASWNIDAHYDATSIEELAIDMLTNGQLQPILVRKHPTIPGQAFEVISGERRHRAARHANMRWLNALYLNPCDDLTAKRISYRDKTYQDTWDIYTGTMDLLRYLAYEYQETPGWPQLLKQHGDPLRVAAWIIRKCVTSFPRIHPHVAEALGATQDELAPPLRLAFREGGPHGSIRGFATNRLGLIDMHPQLLDHVRNRTLDIVAATTLNRMNDEDAMLALLGTAVEEGWSRTQILRAARAHRAGAEQVDHLTLPPAREYQASLKKFSEDDKKAAADAIALLRSLIAKYEPT